MGTKSAVLLVGPTGVGKTAVAIEIASRLGTEIISADSRQIYKELSIGTAVPSPAELKQVKHHLVQHVSVEENYSAAEFEKEALSQIRSILSSHDTVIVCGGSGLYIQAITEGIDDIPPVDPGIRKALLERMESEGLESLRFELKKLDPESYQNIDLRNPKRILKALEISLTTGRPYSGFLTRGKKSRDFNMIRIGLSLEREELYRRINRRVDEMMANGLLEEVESLLAYRELNALNTVGYKELFDFLDGKHELEEAIRLIKRNTRHYARRQLTWFRRDKEITWFRPEESERISTFILKSPERN